MATNTEMKLFGFGGVVGLVASRVDLEIVHIPEIGADLNQNPYKVTLTARDGSTITLSISDVEVTVAEQKS